MKYSAIASTLFAAVAVAQPHGHLHHLRHHQVQHDKRELVTAVEWVTETQYVTKLVDSTTTVWVTPGAESTSDAAKFIESKKKTTTTTSTTSTSVYVAPKPTTTFTTSTSVYVAPTTSSTSTTSTSVYVAPEETSTSTSVYVAPTTSSEEAYVAPTTTSEEYVAPTTSEEAVAAETSASDSGSSSSSSSSGGNTGDMTYYTIGTGSCGINDSGKDDSAAVVALSVGRMAAGAAANGNSNDNSLCGKTITITANGKSTTATIKDQCGGCEYDDIDVSEKVFMDIFGSLDSGRSTVTWEFN